MGGCGLHQGCPKSGGGAICSPRHNFLRPPAVTWTTLCLSSLLALALTLTARCNTAVPRRRLVRKECRISPEINFQQVRPQFGLKAQAADQALLGDKHSLADYE